MKRPDIPLTMMGVLAALLLVACGRQPGHETDRVTDQMEENVKELNKADDQEEWMEERQEAVKELTDLREKLFARQMREEKRLADGIKNTERRAETANHVQELKANIDRIDASLGNLQASTSANWQQVKREAHDLADTTANWFDRQIEKIDRNTDADADNDGH